MSGVVTASRLKRYGMQLIAGLAIGGALGGAVHEARAEDETSLLANPKHLDEVQRGCKANAPWATEALCRQAAQAIRLRFRGDGVPYTPHRVEPFPSGPATPPVAVSPRGKQRTHARPPHALVL